MPFAVWTGFLALVFAYAALAYSGRFSLSPGVACSIYGCFLLQLMLVMAPAFDGSRSLAKGWLSVRSRYFFLLPVWCLPYLIYAAGTGDLRWWPLLRLLAISSAVLLLYLFFPVRVEQVLNWQDAVVAVVLVAVGLSHFLAGIWSIPQNLDFMGRLFLITVGAWSWIFVRQVPGLGYHFFCSFRILKIALANFVFFAIIAVPAGFALRFTAWHPRWRGVGPFLLDYLEIFLFIAVLEELFFRGFLQTLFSGLFRLPLKAQLLVAALFGLFHILHAPFPNWRYVALAAVAGWFYGCAFRQSGSLVAPALTHALVDTVWRTWFSLH